MLFLTLSVACATTIFIIFKLLENRELDPLPIIVINYLVAVVFGSLVILINGSEIKQDMLHWLPGAILIGFAFIVMFILIARSIKVAGITSTSIASKMSVVIPVLFSVLFYHESPGIMRVIGICIAFIALLLTLYKPESGKNSDKKNWIVLPIIIFVGSGIVDTMVKYMQASYLGHQDLFFFNVVVFSVALLCGLILFVLRGVKILGLGSKVNLLFGILLGLANFGSLLFFIKALEKDFIPSSVVFTVNNLGVVSLTVIIAFLFFKEKLNWINWMGIMLAFTAIIMMS